MSAKIIQILAMQNDSRGQGSLLGLADDGTTYYCDDKGRWAPFIPNVSEDAQ